MDDSNKNDYEDSDQNDNGINDEKNTMNSVSDETGHNGISDNNSNNNEDLETTIKTNNDAAIEYGVSPDDNDHMIDVENESTAADEIEVILNNKNNNKKPKSVHNNNNNIDEDEAMKKQEVATIITTVVDSTDTVDNVKTNTNLTKKTSQNKKKSVNKKQTKIRPNYPYGVEILNRYSIRMSPPKREGDDDTNLNEDVDDSDDYITLLLARGSVLDFKCFNKHQVGAIVNAANEGCLCGGGVDGAITDAGGPNLAEARLALPILNEQQQQQQKDDNDNDDGISSPKTSIRRSNNNSNNSNSIGPKIRCYTGSAVLTGPDDNFGEIKVPYVIHAVGPNYYNFAGNNDKQRGHKLLYSAYMESLDVAYKTNHITSIAFCLLSAGIFRASIPLSRILKIALMAIRDWTPPSSSSSASTVVSSTLIVKKQEEVDGTSIKMPSDSNGKDNDQDNIEETVTISNSTSNSCSKRKLNEIIICAYTDHECNTLMELCDDFKFQEIPQRLE